MTFTIAIKTTNPNNGATGNTRRAAIIRTEQRRAQRQTARLHTLAARGRIDPTFPLTVRVTRVAPSGGLDPHDGLGPALKGVIDGIADGLGLKNDRDERVTWVLAQRRGAPRVYAVEVAIVMGGSNG